MKNMLARPARHLDARAAEIRMIAKVHLRLKDYLRKLLGGVGLYQRTKASWIYDFYWTIVDRRIIDDRRRELNFYRDVLQEFRESDLIFDVGANHGYKSDIFLRLGATVVAVEPDEASQVVLEQKFLKYQLKRKPLVVSAKAVSDRSAVEKMWIDTPGSAKNTLSQKWAETLIGDDRRFGHKLSFAHWKEVETVTIEQLITMYGLPFFVKIDVEGHELSVLRGMRQPVPYLSFEVNLPEFKPEGLECVQVLGRIAPDGKFNYTRDCLRGLVLKEWLGMQEFLAVLNSSSDDSIEVFWKTSTLRT
jgi:FkbM family methyltransferase